MSQSPYAPGSIPAFLIGPPAKPSPMPTTSMPLPVTVVKLPAGPPPGVSAAPSTFSAALASAAQARRLDEAEAGFVKLGLAAQTAYAQAYAGITSLAGAADPFQTLPTLTMSFANLGAAIGQVLLPYVDALSLGVQRVTGWIDSLDASTKSFGGRILMTGALVLAGTAIIVKLGFAAVATAKMIGVAVSAIYAFSGPIGIVLAAAAAVYGLAMAWQATGDAASAAAGKMSGINGPDAGDARKNVFDPAKDLRGLPQADRDAIDAASAKSARDGARKIAELQAQAAREAAALNAGMAGGTAKEKAVQYLDRSTAIVEEFMAEGKSPEFMAQVLNAAARKQFLDAYRTLGVEQPQGADLFRRQSYLDKVPADERNRIGTAARANQRAAILAEAARKVGAEDGHDSLKRSYAGLPEPRIATMPDVANRFQVAALKADDLKTELLQRQLDALIEIRGILNNRDQTVARGEIKPWRTGHD